MLDAAREIIGTQPILAIFLAIGLGYLVGQINIGGFSLGVGAVLFVGLAIGGVRAKGADHRSDQPDRADHVPLRHRHSLRPAVLRGHDRRGRPQVQSAGAAGVVAGLDRGARRSARCSASSSATRSGLFAGSDDQHRHAAGRARRHGQQGSVDRLFRRVSLRRDRPDPVLLLHDPEGEAEVSRRSRSASTWAR